MEEKRYWTMGGLHSICQCRCRQCRRALRCSPTVVTSDVYEWISICKLSHTDFRYRLSLLKLAKHSCAQKSIPEKDFYGRGDDTMLPVRAALVADCII